MAFEITKINRNSSSLMNVLRDVRGKQNIFSKTLRLVYNFFFLISPHLWLWNSGLRKKKRNVAEYLIIRVNSSENSTETFSTGFECRGWNKSKWACFSFKFFFFFFFWSDVIKWTLRCCVVFLDCIIWLLLKFRKSAGERILIMKQQRGKAWMMC